MPGIVYSGFVQEDQGFSAPVPFNGPPGWTVHKSNQTEIFRITHNLHLTDPDRQLHVVVTSKKWSVMPSVQKLADAFVVTMMVMPAQASSKTDFDFVAVYYPPKPKMP